MHIPKDLKYAKSHEWVRVENNIAYVGISDYAQESLGDIVYVELPNTDDEVNKGDEVLTIESVKAASPVYSPVSGVIIEVNEDLEDTPEIINEAPYDNYIFAIDMSDPSELDDLMDADEYEEHVENEKNKH